MILTLIAEAVLGTVVEHAGDALKKRFTTDAAQRSFALALGQAVNDYIQTVGAAVAQPLLKDDGILTLPLVQNELAQVIRFERGPDITLIGREWRDALDTFVGPRDFSRDARILLNGLQARLRETEMFRPVFMLKQLDAIAENALASVEELTEIRQQLAHLTILTNGYLGQLAQQYYQATPLIQEHLRTFDAWYYIEEKTRQFVGREYIFQALDNFLGANPNGYFLIDGDPGSGKSALCAQLVKQRGYLHHFNIRTSTYTSSHFLTNLCAQLIARYELPYETLPLEQVQDGGFLEQLLREVAQKLNGKQCVIVVDALDEVDLEPKQTHNILHLPSLLPVGIYFVLASRRINQIALRMESPYKPFHIQQDDEANRTDIRQYINLHVNKPGIQAYLQKNNIDATFLEAFLVYRSEGNFMYIRLVLPDIEHGVYHDLALEQLPLGLMNYYESHWLRMRRQNEFDWFDHKLPVIIALTISKESMPVAILGEFAQVKDLRRVRGVLQDWDQFLYRTEVYYREQRETRYRWYHSSFFDFIAQKQDVAEERVNLKSSYRQGLEAMLQDLGWQ